VNFFSLYTTIVSHVFHHLVSAISHDKATEELSKFDKGQLKHTTTAEKNPLPDKDGKYSFLFCLQYNLSIYRSGKSISI